MRCVSRAHLAAVGGSAPARALVGAADLPCHLHQTRSGDRRSCRVPHDRARGRPAARLLGRPRGRAAASPSLPRRLCQRGRHPHREHADKHDPRRHRGGRPRTHAHDDRDRVPQHPGHGAGPGLGHGRGTEPGRQPDRCHPRRRNHPALDPEESRCDRVKQPTNDKLSMEGTTTMKLTTTTQVSVDGVMQGPGGPDEDERAVFERGGWAHFDNEAGTVMDEIFQRADAFLFGRRTYEIFAGSWGTWADPGDSPIWTALNTKPKYVASTTLTDPQWTNTIVLSSEVAKAIRELKAKPGRELQVQGSVALLRWLLDNQLVDEITLFKVPE